MANEGIASNGNPAHVPPRVFRGNLAGWRPPEFASTLSLDRPAQITRFERDTLFPKHHLESGLGLVQSYGSIKLLDHESLLFVARQHGPRQPDGSWLPQPSALRLLGTQFLVLPEQQAPQFAEKMTPLPASGILEGAALWRMMQTLPRAWIVRDIAVLPPLPVPLRTADVDERTREMLFPGLKPRDFSRSAVIETATKNSRFTTYHSLPTTRYDPASEHCHFTRYSPQHVIVETQLTRPGLVVLSDAFYPGWKATVTAPGMTRELPIHRTNRVCRGVWLPAGLHVIEFRYRPGSFLVGAFLSAAGWCALAIAALAFANSRRTKPIVLWPARN